MKKMFNLFCALILAPAVFMIGCSGGTEMVQQTDSITTFGGICVLFVTIMVTYKLFGKIFE